MNFIQKMRETATAIIPVVILVLILHFTFAPLPLDILASFIIGALLIIVGLGIFLAGADLGIVPAGSMLGAALTKTRKLPIILISVGLISFIITIAEPNLKVQGELVHSVTGTIPAMQLVVFASAGLGIAVMFGIMRILFQLPYRIIIIIGYCLAFAFAAFSDSTFVAIAFDSSGASTGSLTVPFFIALGLGVSSVRGDKTADEDSFGTTGIAAIGPILAVSILGFITNATGSETAAANEAIAEEAAVQVPVVMQFVHQIMPVTKDVTQAMLPLALILGFFQIVLLKLPPAQVRRLAKGIFYTWFGLILFFLGANTGFIPSGTALGEVIGALSWNWVLIPLGCIMGAIIVCAEPAVWVLSEQVEEVSSGNIRRPVLLAALALGVAATVGLSMWRVLSGFSIWYLLLPTFGIALALTFISPKLFTAIAFDSGSVATGPLSSTFILTLTIGASLTSGGNPDTDAFGLIAMIAVAPPISIQLLGFMFHRKELRAIAKKKAASQISETSERGQKNNV